MQTRRHEDRVSHVEADKSKQRAHQHDSDAAVTELGPGLDHLRQPELRALRGMKRDEYGAEQNSERAGQGCEAEAQTHARPDEPDRNRKKVKISQKPERALVNHPAVPFVLGNVIDRFALDSHPFPVNVFNPMPR